MSTSDMIDYEPKYGRIAKYGCGGCAVVFGVAWFIVSNTINSPVSAVLFGCGMFLFAYLSATIEPDVTTMISLIKNAI